MYPVKKVCFVGECNTGKTSFLRSCIKSKFTAGYIPTVGANVHTLGFITDEDEESKVKLEIWDCSGSKNNSLGQIYWVGADAMVVFYIANDRKSYNQAKNAILEIHRFFENKKIPIILISTKNDLFSQNRIVQTIDIPYFQVSSRSGENVNRALTKIVECVHNKKISIANPCEYSDDSDNGCENGREELKNSSTFDDSN